jgi:renalase
MTDVRIAVIGAGMAGLACASELARADAKVTVFERARGLGGRLTTRRQGDLAFDHGAQFITARSRPFVRYTETALRAGVLAPWQPRLMEDERSWDAPIGEWWVGQPGMSALVRPLTRNVEIRGGVTVHEILAGQRGWELLTDAGRHDTIFDALAVAVPAPQAFTLLGPHGRAFRHLGDVQMSPCWAGLFTFDAAIDAGADARRWTQGPLAWACCDSSKPGRSRRQHSWVVHATPTWSQEHLELDSHDVARQLLLAFGAAIGRALPPPTYLAAHRWRHALVHKPLGLPCLVDEELAAGACGDWCIAPRVEAAFESGRSLAHSLLSTVGLAAAAARR